MRERARAGVGMRACLGTKHLPVLKRTVDICLDGLDGKLRPVGPAPHLEGHGWLGYGPEGWSTALCLERSTDSFLPSVSAASSPAGSQSPASAFLSEACQAYWFWFWSVASSWCPWMYPRVGPPKLWVSGAGLEVTWA